MLFLLNPFSLIWKKCTCEQSENLSSTRIHPSCNLLSGGFIPLWDWNLSDLITKNSVTHLKFSSAHEVYLWKVCSLSCNTCWDLSMYRMEPGTPGEDSKGLGSQWGVGVWLGVREENHSVGKIEDWWLWKQRAQLSVATKLLHQDGGGQALQITAGSLAASPSLSWLTSLLAALLVDLPSF